VWTPEAPEAYASAWSALAQVARVSGSRIFTAPDARARSYGFAVTISSLLAPNLKASSANEA